MLACLPPLLFYAFLAGMKEQTAEIEAIANNTEAPTFENTIVALDNSGRLLSRVSRVFYGLKSAETNDSIQALAEATVPSLIGTTTTTST